MENITIGQIAVALAFIVALAASIKTLRKDLKKWIADANKDEFEALKKANKEEFDSLKKELQTLKSNQDSIDLENCKNYLVTFLSELERGEPKDEIEYQRFWEQYEHYISKGGNTYIKHRVDLLKSISKL